MKLHTLSLQEDQPAGLGNFVQLPELKSRVSEQGQEAYVDHCDLISQALMERILQFTEESMDTVSSSDGQPSSGKAQPEGGVESMEEDNNGGDGFLTVDGGGGGGSGLYDGGSGPPSLGSLSLSSQPTSLGQQPHSLSISTGIEEREREIIPCFLFFMCFPFQAVQHLQQRPHPQAPP